MSPLVVAFAELMAEFRAVIACNLVDVKSLARSTSVTGIDTNSSFQSIVAIYRSASWANADPKCPPPPGRLRYRGTSVCRPR